MASVTETSKPFSLYKWKKADANLDKLPQTALIFPLNVLSWINNVKSLLKMANINHASLFCLDCYFGVSGFFFSLMTFSFSISNTTGSRCHRFTAQSAERENKQSQQMYETPSSLSSSLRLCETSSHIFPSPASKQDK